MNEWGKNEVIVGVGAAQEFGGLDIGGKIKVGRDGLGGRRHLLRRRRHG